MLFGLSFEFWGAVGGLAALLSFVGYITGTLPKIWQALFSADEALPTATGTTPAVRIPVHNPFPKGPRLNLPNLPREVEGRETALTDMREGLRKHGRAGIVNSGAVLKGQGGVGKSTLARYYAHRYSEEYHGILWADAATSTALVEDLHRLYPALNQPRPDPCTPATARDILDRLTGEQHRWLLIYDNVETFADIRGLLPATEAPVHLIVTTREGAGFPGFAEIEADSLSFAEETGPATRLLTTEAGRTEDRAGARDLAEALGGLPLALVVAGGIAKRSGESWAAIGAQIERILKTAPGNEAYPDSVFGAVKLSYDRLSDDAKRVARLCAWWAPEGLSPELLTAAPDSPTFYGKFAGDIPKTVADLARDADKVRAAFEELEDRSLLRRTDGSYAMHRMTAAALRALQTGTANLSPAAAALLAAVYPADPYASGTWPICRRLTPHVRALWGSGGAPEIAAMDFLLNQAGNFLGYTGDNDGALAMSRASLTIKQARLPEDHRDIALGRANLGDKLRATGDLPGAEAELRRAVALDREHRPDSLDLAGKLDLLGHVLLDKGDLKGALRAYQEAAGLARRLAPPQSHLRAQVANNLAVTRRRMGQGAAVFRLLRWSLRERRRVLAPGDVRLAAGLLGVGAGWLEAGRADKAEPLLREALDLRRANHLDAPRHPDIVIAAQWLDGTLRVRARAGEDSARRLAEAADLCATYGLNPAEHDRHSDRFPYTPGQG